MPLREDRPMVGSMAGYEYYLMPPQLPDQTGGFGKWLDDLFTPYACGFEGSDRQTPTIMLPEEGPPFSPLAGKR